MHSTSKNDYCSTLVVNNVKIDQQVIKSLISESIDNLMLKSLSDPFNIIPASIMTLIYANSNFTDLQMTALELLIEYRNWWASLLHLSGHNIANLSFFDHRTQSSTWKEIHNIHTIYHDAVFTYLVDKDNNIITWNCTSYKNVKEHTSKVNKYLNLYSKYTMLQILQLNYHDEINMSLNLPFLQRISHAEYKKNIKIYNTIRNNIIKKLHDNFTSYGRYVTISIRSHYLNNFFSDSFANPAIKKEKDIYLHANIIFIGTQPFNGKRSFIMDPGCDICFVGDVLPNYDIFLYSSNITVRGKVDGRIFNLYGNIKIHTPQSHVSNVFSAFGTVSVNNKIILNPREITHFSTEKISDLIYTPSFHQIIKGNVNNSCNKNSPSIYAIKIYEKYFSNLPSHPINSPSTSLLSTIEEITSEIHKKTTPLTTSQAVASSSNASSSNAPSSNAPSSNAPSSNAPSSNAPSSNAPSSNAPSSNAPSSNAPSSNAPSSNAPSSNAPSSNAPSSNAPSSNAPSSNAPSSNAPLSNAPSSNAPSSNTPSSNTPSSNTPSSNAPSSNAPSSNAPSSNTPSSNAPSSNAPSSNAPSSNAPSSNAPSSNAPSSNAPSSNTPSSNTPPLSTVLVNTITHINTLKYIKSTQTLHK